MTCRQGVNPAVFFDRDGTLNTSALPGEYIRNPTSLQLLPGAAAAVRQVNNIGLLAILATNQRWLSEPGVDPNVYSSIELELGRLLAIHGARLDASYTCPHAAYSCHCRKPLPGLLLKAAEDLDVNLSKSYFIGDSTTDAEAGAAVGATTILISQQPPSEFNRCANYVVSNIQEAVGLILDVYS